MFILNISNDNTRDFSFCDIDYKISDANANESDSGNETGDAPVSNWLEVIHMNPGPTIIIPVQDTKHEAVVPSSFDFRTDHVDYFYPFYYQGLLCLILQETKQNKSNMKTQNILSTKRH